MQSKIVTIDLGHHEYDIYIGTELLGRVQDFLVNRCQYFLGGHVLIQPLTISVEEMRLFDVFFSVEHGHR